MLFLELSFLESAKNSIKSHQSEAQKKAACLFLHSFAKMGKFSGVVLSLLLVPAKAQQEATQIDEVHPPFSYSTCTVSSGKSISLRKVI